MSIRYLPEADAEYEAGLAWYLRQSEQAALRFEAEVNAALERIAEDPESFPWFDDVHQFLVLNRFPYHIVFRHEATQIVIVAVAHGKKRPQYWKDRGDS